MVEEMLDYLKQPCFKRLFTLAKNKIQSLNGLRGTVVLDNLSLEDQDLIGGFLGKNCLGLTKVKVSLAELDDLLRNSPLETGLHAFLEVYWQERIVTNQEKNLHAEHQWSNFFEQLHELAQTPVSRDWLDQLFQGDGNGYRTLLALYRQNSGEAGLLDDDISSNVAIAGLRVCPDDPRFAVFDCANATSSPLILPLCFFGNQTLWRPEQKVYVVENPAVFSTFLDTCPTASPPPLVCGSGQLSVAALNLLDQLVQADCTIYYSGDFDVKGLEIATRLAQRYQPNFRPWCYDSEIYLSVASGKRMPLKEINSLQKLAVPWDEHLTARMAERKLCFYQSNHSSITSNNLPINASW